MSVWFYELTADGYSLDDKRLETPEQNDLPDIIAKWPSREEGPNCFNVPIEKIRENDWQLAISRYKPIRLNSIHHELPTEILADVIQMETDIIERPKALMKRV